MESIGSKRVTSTVIPTGVDGGEQIIEFVQGLSKVSKKVKRFLLGRSPDLYFDPDNLSANDLPFKTDMDGVSYYISKTMANPDNAARLCSLLKAAYETLQGELLSGKYSAQQRAQPSPQAVASGIAGNTPFVNESEQTEEDDEEIDGLVSGAGDSINTDDSEDIEKKDKKKKKKKKKKNKKKAQKNEDEEDEE